MQPPEQPEKQPYNLNNELAKERTRAAADRTLMAWIRTALSLIGFGFGIPTIVSAIQISQIGQNINPYHFSSVIGLAFISIALYAMYAALKEHRKILRQIKSDRYLYESSNIAEHVGFTLILVGGVSFIGVLIKAITY